MIRSHASSIRVPAALIATLGASGCFFTAGINSEPQAQIETTAAGPYWRGQTVSLTAYKSDDPDDDPLLVRWRAFTCAPERNACDADAFAELIDASLTKDFSFVVPLRRTAPGPDEPTAVVLVVGTVRDRHGATHEDRLFLDIGNRPPELSQVQVQGQEVTPGSGAYPLGSYLRVLALATDPDGDDVTLSWRYTAPVASDPTQVGWDAIDDGYLLEPDVQGQWTVEITAEDELGATDTVTVPMDVRPDALPCIATTQPLAVTGSRYIVDHGGLARRFAVLSVSDDLDPYPVRLTEPYYGSARFRWFLASPDTGGALIELAAHEEPDYLIDPTAFAPGDRIGLRVEIDDRVGRQIVCDPQSPTCSLSGDQCMQRVSWEVEIR